MKDQNRGKQMEENKDKENENVIERIEREIEKINKNQIIKLPIWAE